MVAFLDQRLILWLATQYQSTGRRFLDRIGALILPAIISEGHVLLTNFGSPRTTALIEIDILTTDGILYKGGLRDYWFNAEGDLSGLLLSKAARYDRIQYSAHQQVDLVAAVEKGPDEPTHKFTRDRATYWRFIPGADLFYIPRERIANVNVKNVTPAADVPKATEERLLTARSLVTSLPSSRLRWSAVLGKGKQLQILVRKP